MRVGGIDAIALDAQNLDVLTAPFLVRGGGIREHRRRGQGEGLTASWRSACGAPWPPQSGCADAAGGGGERGRRWRVPVSALWRVGVGSAVQTSVHCVECVCACRVTSVGARVRQSGGRGVRGESTVTSHRACSTRARSHVGTPMERSAHRDREHRRARCTMLHSDPGWIGAGHRMHATERQECTLGCRDTADGHAPM